MGELSDQRREGTYGGFVERWLEQVVGVFLTVVRDPALAYDLTTETLAQAHLQWDLAPAGEEAVTWVLRLGALVLTATAERGSVPATERRRAGQPAPLRLSVAEQREIRALAEEHLELPTSARDAADALARTAPPPHVLAALRLSVLVEAEPLPSHDRQHDGR